MDEITAPAGLDWPHLPRLLAVGDDFAPQAPVDVQDTDIDPAVLRDLALKAVYTVPQCTTEWVARRLHLPQPLTAELLERLREDHLIEVLGTAGPFGYRFAASGRGRERANRLFEISGYVGPAPVSLAAYTAMVEWQDNRRPQISAAEVNTALDELVLPEEVHLIAGLAMASGRSLFVTGPPGNGKSSLGRLLHQAVHGSLWVPHCLAVDSAVVRIFDQQCHHPDPLQTDQTWAIDQRWVRVRRPLVVVGGEMTLEAFDLSYSQGLRFYEAPLHVKANGGTYLIDDFGRQRVDPHQLLNRWIIPLEHQVDYLTLQTGQKIQVPFRLMLIIATNLDPGAVTDAAFLRRMGYRLYLGDPSPEDYATILRRYAARQGLEVPPALLARLLERYRAEKRILRACEPRDLIERACDICRFRGQPPRLTDEVLDLAWTGYFGNQ